MDELLARIERDFTYHAPLPGQFERYTAIREKAHEFAIFIATATPPSHEQDTALDLLNLATMSANAAIARNE